MKKILLSLLMIGAVLSIAGVGTWAYFTDEEKSMDNTFTTGIVDVTLSPGDQQQVTASVGSGCNQEETTRLKPCYVGWLTYNVKNVGDNPVDIYLKLDNVEDVDLGQSEPEQVADPSGRKYDISKHIEIDINGRLVEGETLHSIQGKWFKIDGPLQPNDERVIRLSFHLKNNAGNEYQSDQSFFDVFVEAQQLGMPAPNDGDDNGDDDNGDDDNGDE